MIACWGEGDGNLEWIMVTCWSFLGTTEVIFIHVVGERVWSLIFPVSMQKLNRVPRHYTKTLICGGKKRYKYVFHVVLFFFNISFIV